MRNAYGVDTDLSISGEGVSYRWGHFYHINAILIYMGADIKKIEKIIYRGVSGSGY